MKTIIEPFRMKVIDYDIDLQQVENFMGKHSNQVVTMEQARQFWQDEANTDL